MINFPPALKTLLNEGRVEFAGMIRFDFGTGSFGFIRAEAPYTFGGITFQPFPAGILTVSDLPYSSGTSADGFTILFSENDELGLTPNIMQNVEFQDYRDRPVTIYDLHRHPDTGAVLGNPIVRKKGYINVIDHIKEPDQGFYINIQCETRTIDYNRTNGRNRTNEDQLRRSSTDNGFIHAATTGRIKIKWGKN